MIEPSMSSFWQAALRSGLLDEGTLRGMWDSIPAEKRTAEAIDRRLARQVVNAGNLTLWQAQQILAGRWQGLRIDKYELKNVIGQGGMGRVYLARDVRLDRKVALKILSRERMNNARALARFRREAKVGAQLQHENLVRIYDEGESHGVRYLVMEYIEGKTVGRLISELGRIPPQSAADIARRVALGLEQMHQKGLLHRDVNPMNILIDRDGTPKLTDLGLAIDLGDDDDIVTRDGATVGTFDYISPEQARHSRMVDARADVYSLGCTLYHMLSGRVPFPSPSLAEKLYAHQLNDPEPLTNYVPDLPEGLASVVRKLMRKAPEDRCRRASDAARALEPFAGNALSASRIARGLSSTTLEAPAVRSADALAERTVGSDPDLELQPSPATSTPSSLSPSTQPIDLLRQIDLGPAPSISGSRSNEVRKTGPIRLIRTRPIPRGVIAAGLAGMVLIASAIGAYRLWGSRSKSGSPGIASPPSIPTGDSEGSSGDRPAIAIRFADGHEVAQPSLRDAIARLAGGGGEIILRSKANLQAGEPGKAIHLGGGHLTIRAADGASPEILVVLDRSAPWLDIGAGASLGLIGVTIDIEVSSQDDPKPDAPPPRLISTDGPLSFDRCRFRTSGGDRSPLVVVSRARAARLSGCFFEGFDMPIALEMYPDSKAEFKQCLFVRDAPNPRAGWVVSVTRKLAMSEAPRSLSLDRCTAIGSGLLVADGFTPEGPLSVTVEGTAVKTAALLMTAISKPVLAKSLVWTGRDNRYAISGVAWIVKPPRGFDGLEGGPSDLKSWTDLFPKDVGSESTSIQFAVSSREGHLPPDYAVVTDGDAGVGADPSKMGLEGSP